MSAEHEQSLGFSVSVYTKKEDFQNHTNNWKSKIDMEIRKQI